MSVQAFFSKTNTVLSTQAPGAQTATWTSPDITVDGAEELLVGFELTALTGTGPTAQLVLDIKLPDGTYIQGVKSLTALSATGNQLLTVKAATLPADATPLFYLAQALGGTIRFRVVIAGTTPSATFTITVQGK